MGKFAAFFKNIFLAMVGLPLYAAFLAVGGAVYVISESLAVFLGAVRKVTASKYSSTKSSLVKDPFFSSVSSSILGAHGFMFREVAFAPYIETAELLLDVASDIMINSGKEPTATTNEFDPQFATNLAALASTSLKGGKKSREDQLIEKSKVKTLNPDNKKNGSPRKSEEREPSASETKVELPYRLKGKNRPNPSTKPLSALRTGPSAPSHDSPRA